MLHILGIGSSHPSTIIDNEFIESLEVGTSAQWIEEKIGIKQRRSTLLLDYIKTTRNLNPEQALSSASMTVTELAVLASHMACKRAGIKPEQVGLLICNCCTPLCTLPVEAERISTSLGIKAPAYEVFTACPAFALHLNYLSNFEEEALPEYVLCISTAALTQHVNYYDRSDGAIWGDGAAAWIVSAKHTGRLKIIDPYFSADPLRCDAVVVDRYGFFHQDGRAVRDFSVRHTVRLVKDLESRYEINWDKDIFIGHQANATMLQQIIENRGIPHKNHWHNVDIMGNQAGAGAPAVLAMHWEDIKQGQKIIVAVVGAGLSWGSVILEGINV